MMQAFREQYQIPSSYSCAVEWSGIDVNVGPDSILAELPFVDGA